MDPSCFVLMVSGCWWCNGDHFLEQCCNATDCLTIIADHIHPLMFPTGFLNMTVNSLEWPQQSPDLSPMEHHWDVVEWAICFMDVQLHDAITSI